MIITKVGFDMENKNALLTFAMLSVSLKHYKKDYYDLLLPFVKNILNEIGEIDQEILQKELNETFGLKIPIKIIEILLQRLSKEKIVEKRERKYYVVSIPDKTKFENDKRLMKNNLDDITHYLMRYLSDNASKNYTEEQVVKGLFYFFSHHAVAVLNNVEDLITEKFKRNDLSYSIGRFIILNYQDGNPNKIFDCVRDVLIGFITWLSIYFYFDSAQSNRTIKYKNTDFYIDTPILMDFLNYHNDFSQKSAKELIELIRKNEGKICVFSTCVDEIVNNLKNYK